MADLPILNALSVDVEDWFQVGAFETVIDRDSWDSREARVEAASTRASRESQLSRSITVSNAPTWNQSSTSTESALRIGRSAMGSGGVFAPPHAPRGSAVALDPVDQQRQH